MSDNNRYNIRHLARLVIETQTPIAVGSGEKDIETDARIIKDINGLPYIPATSIAGVLRHTMKESFEGNKSKEWGFQLGGKKPEGTGSRIIFTNANIVDEDGTVVDGIYEREKSELLKHFEYLPIRQHARIDHKGVTVKGGKFDEEVVYKGTRFCFEIEMLGIKDDNSGEYFNNLLKHIHSEELRIGGGTRSGFGELKVVACKTTTLNLESESGADLKKYINKSSSLSDTSFWDQYEETNISGNEDSYVSDTLNIKPQDFFLFGSGFGDEDADMTPVHEAYIKWENNKAIFVEEKKNILIPATSVKGALAHRVAYHYNRFTGRFADQLLKTDDVKARDEMIEKLTGKNNPAVRSLFGSEGNRNSKDKKEKRAKRGNVMISDIIEQKSGNPDKLLNHVAIDRFTGGAMEGALFTEKVSDEQGKEFKLKITVDTENVKNAFEAIQNKEENDSLLFVYKALDAAIDDICKGHIPLGGGVNRGNGLFYGNHNEQTFTKFMEESL